MTKAERNNKIRELIAVKIDNPRRIALIKWVYIYANPYRIYNTDKIEWLVRKVYLYAEDNVEYPIDTISFGMNESSMWKWSNVCSIKRSFTSYNIKNNVINNSLGPLSTINNY